MSNLSDDTLRKVSFTLVTPLTPPQILQQIQTQAVTAQRQHSLVRAQIQSKEKERKILDLTVRELATVPKSDDTRMFRGVGKMFIEQPRSEINARHEAQQKTLTTDIDALTKKAKYFERQVEEANGQLRDIFHSQNRERA
ncbi:Prefoldin subunit 1 [Vanrija pseudolonga]|uniref:Prefoldin subunit 1 n=1 Tax=Vanrija pseudolonga TaxID=143232 RepID=A0AAF0Y8F6_9TREE|nr:Prefoldin subunit 1 [Vanrija pseudolonga]